MPPLSCGVLWSLDTSLALNEARRKFHQKWTRNQQGTTITHLTFKQEKRQDIVLTFKIMCSLQHCIVNTISK